MATPRRRTVIRGIRREAAKLTVRPTIIEALENPRLLGALPEFRDLTSWRRWMTILKATYGLVMTPEEHRWLCDHTTHTTFDPRGYWTLVVSVGRQAGKSTIVAAMALYEAVFASPDLGGDHVVVVAQDFRAAVRGLFEKIVAPFEKVAAFHALVKTPRAESLDLTNGVHIAAFPCRPAAIRGPSSRLTALDEGAWLRDSEGTSQDKEMLRAIEPGLAMGGPLDVEGRRRPGRLVILSSPAGESGMFYDLFTRHWGRDDSPVLVVQAAAVEMNLLLPPDYMARMKEDDPEGYQAEALGQFRGGQSALLDPVAVRASVQKNRTDFPYREGVAYVLQIDASSGKRDPFAWAIGHRDGDEMILDVVRRRVPGPNFSTGQIMDEIAEQARDYHVVEAMGDAYAVGFTQDGFRDRGIEFRQTEKPGTTRNTVVSINTSELMLESINPFHSGLVRLPDNQDLVAELIALERRRSTVAGVRDRVVVPPGRTKDMATVVAGVIFRLRVKPKRRKMLEYEGDIERGGGEAAGIIPMAPTTLPAPRWYHQHGRVGDTVYDRNGTPTGTIVRTAAEGITMRGFDGTEVMRSRSFIENWQAERIEQAQIDADATRRGWTRDPDDPDDWIREDGMIMSAGRIPGGFGAVGWYRHDPETDEQIGNDPDCLVETSPTEMQTAPYLRCEFYPHSCSATEHLATRFGDKWIVKCPNNRHRTGTWTREQLGNEAIPPDARPDVDLYPPGQSAERGTKTMAWTRPEGGSKR